MKPLTIRFVLLPEATKITATDIGLHWGLAIIYFKENDGETKRFAFSKEQFPDHYERFEYFYGMGMWKEAYEVALGAKKTKEALDHNSNVEIARRLALGKGTIGKILHDGYGNEAYVFDVFEKDHCVYVTYGKKDDDSKYCVWYDEFYRYYRNGDGSSAV